MRLPVLQLVALLFFVRFLLAVDRLVVVLFLELEPPPVLSLRQRARQWIGLVLLWPVLVQQLERLLEPVPQLEPPQRLWLVRRLADGRLVLLWLVQQRLWPEIDPAQRVQALALRLRVVGQAQVLVALVQAHSRQG